MAVVSFITRPQVTAHSRAKAGSALENETLTDISPVDVVSAQTRRIRFIRKNLFTNAA